MPSIPPKQAIGNTERDFVTERKMMLNTFLKELAKYKFFVDSVEFGLFANYTSEKLVVQKRQLAKETAVQRLEKY